MKRKTFIEKHGADQRDAHQWVNRYSTIGESRDKGKSGDGVTSKRTRDNYIDLMTKVSRELRLTGSTLDQCTPKLFTKILNQFSTEIGQTSLNNMRIAGEKGFRSTSKYSQVKLPVIKSEVKQILNSRAYTIDAMKVIHDRMSERHRLSFEVASVMGLRAHEIFELRPEKEQPRDERKWTDLYPDRQGWVPYTVVGKGGFSHLKMLPPELAERLEQQRIPERTVRDRRIEYKQVYNLIGGNNLSSAFSRQSKISLNFSYGLHGIRHSYAQRRMEELPRSGLSREEALLIVSQEMGHLSPEITETYLR